MDLSKLMTNEQILTLKTLRKKLLLRKTLAGKLQAIGETLPYFGYNTRVCGQISTIVKNDKLVVYLFVYDIYGELEPNPVMCLIYDENESVDQKEIDELVAEENTPTNIAVQYATLEMFKVQNNESNLKFSGKRSASKKKEDTDGNKTSEKTEEAENHASETTRRSRKTD